MKHLLTPKNLSLLALVMFFVGTVGGGALQSGFTLHPILSFVLVMGLVLSIPLLILADFGN